ncbi:MAG: WD40 repeat domain-containing serine/threonine protein kinase, partial [Planctomycetota bacterium]|nr:WD40 repeat domain-containing serine/threonine protein kinase [Planctomycetota bacterium]
MSPTPAPTPDAPLVVATFLARYLVDRENHGTLTLHDYQALFPGYEDVIAREWARLFEDPDEQQGRFDVVRQGMDGRRLGRYRIERELGRGGQGVVYLAQDEALRRPVALKILPAALAQTVEMRQRFLREAEAASRLDDPGICTVYETGEEEGVAYIAMRYVEGESLAARLGRMAFDEETLPDRSGVRDWVELIARCSEALHAAHEAGLVHRDIKPGNVMVAPDGRPVILDFGLARMEDHPDGSLTRTGDILGTPAYMSPEQVAAREEPIDRRSDVFSLGATLYECLAQRRAFSAPTRERLYRQIENVDPPPPSRFNKSIPRDLDVVVACALDKDPERRYATAAAFAEDLRRVLGREPVSARPAGPVVRTARWAERNPVVAALSCLIFVGLGAFGVWQGLQATALSGALEDASASEQLAKDALAAVTASEKQIAEELVRSEGARCAALAAQVIDDNAELAVLLAKEALRVHPSPAARSAAWDALARFQPRTLVQFEEGAAWWCALSPSGDRLVVGLNNPKGIEIWDTASLTTRIRRIPFDKGQLERWCVSPTGDVIAVAQKLESRATTIVHLISLATGVTRHKLPHDGLVGALAFSADGELLATGTAKD